MFKRKTQKSKRKFFFTVISTFFLFSFDWRQNYRRTTKYAAILSINITSHSIIIIPKHDEIKSDERMCKICFGQILCLISSQYKKNRKKQQPKSQQENTKNRMTKDEREWFTEKKGAIHYYFSPLHKTVNHKLAQSTRKCEMPVAAAVLIIISTTWWYCNIFVKRYEKQQHLRIRMMANRKLPLYYYR